MFPPDSGSGDSGSGQPVPGKKLTVQEIIKKIQNLNDRLSNAKRDDGDQNNNSHVNVGGNSITTAIDGHPVAEENVATDPARKEKKEEKKDDHKDENSKKGQSDHQKEKGDLEKVKGELEKLCKELEFMKLAFQKLKKFEDDLTKPFQTLEKNVVDIEKDLRSGRNRYSKQVQSNLRVLRNNITKIKIQIPLQHHTTQTNSESRGYKETVASKEHDDLPNLNHNESKLKQSAYCKELIQKYEKCLDDRHKLCLLSFAVFPENAEVKERLLRYWWVGEDIIPPDGREKKFTNETLKTFVEMKFIEPVNKKNKLSPRSYRMYPIVRSALIIKAGEERFFDYDDDGNPTMDFLKCYKACLVKAEEESSRISKHFSKNEEELGKLETLFNVSEQFPDFKEEWFSKMKRVRVLYLGRWESSTDRHIEVESTVCFKGLSKMKNLRFLSLQGISGIKTLPNSLCQAAKLSILDLRACHNLEELPDNIGSLKKLTLLDISECYLLDQMPKELSSLSELKIFKGFVISDHEKTCSLEELAALKKLEKLSINIIDKDYLPGELGYAIPNFEKLKKLKIAWGGATLTAGAGEESKELSSKEKETDNEKRQKSGKKSVRRTTTLAKQKPGNVAKIVKLELQCYPETTPPSWLAPKSEFLDCLEKLYIKGGRLHNLPEIVPETETKWKAKILRLKYLSDLKTDWKELQEMFPDLEYLERVRCPKVMFCPCDGDGWCQLTPLLKDGVES
ncbi:hypothetical protein SLEP1_g23678 [Rubroshorea leprosula]|uniref:Disease resistance R13L4/SHOC-2-like LRR domain-containing protein n=1 Tax=Rubroshorea leprosula TaxID=152421 RepID=A0AAV5JNJ8_9ROSI|nr:hypothetical protein SLEP1_g23678 [Rubroshorea leprosula]